jgi:signal transduction histidine kinase
VNPLRSVGARLSLALLLVVAGALGLVYVVVVPQLQEHLISAKISQLRRSSGQVGRPLGRLQWNDWVDRASLESNNARVILFSSSPQPSLLSLADSNGVNTKDVPESDPIAVRAAVTNRLQSGRATRAGEQFAEVAAPAGRDLVALYSAPLHDTLSNVHLVQRRLLWAGLAALLLSLVIGYGAASLFTRRIRRLERAADRIADGKFDEPVVDAAEDELGQLARAFERMRRRLAHLDRARREFIANASHELRTPLFSLGGFLELLTDEELDEQTRREFFATMNEQVERLGRLATDLLDLSRLDAGRMHVDLIELDLAELARSLRDEFAAVALASDHPLAVEANGEVPARGDEQRVLRIGRALIENAIRHTPSGTDVRVRATARDGAAVLAVEDAGPGIPAEETGQLFERFYRLGGGRSSGSGLGLAIARELAELMGGKLELRSRPGSTAFLLVLPAAVAASADGSFSRENELATRALQ